MLKDIKDLALERAILNVVRVGSLNVFAKIAVVFAAGLPFVFIFGTVYYHITDTPYYVSLLVM